MSDKTPNVSISVTGASSARCGECGRWVPNESQACREHFVRDLAEMRAMAVELREALATANQAFSKIRAGTIGEPWGIAHRAIVNINAVLTKSASLADDQEKPDGQ